MNLLRIASLALVAGGLAAQTTTVFPAEYTNVAEGPFNSPNLPFANGTSRVMVVYEQQDLAIPAGAQITKLGFRQDATLTAMDTGRSLQLEVRMGYTANTSATVSTTFDSNYAGAPTTVFGPALYVLPNLRDANAPLPNGQFFLNLTTPFTYTPANGNLVVEYRVLGNSGGGTSFNYRLDRADYYSPVVLGPAGCQHSGGTVPQLTASPVRVGASLTLTGASCPANSFGIVIVNVGAELITPYPLTGILAGIDPACVGQIAPGDFGTLGSTTSSSGGFTLSYPVPNNPLFNDVFLSHQALILDAFSPGGLVVSNGAQVQIGIRPRSTVLAVQGPPNTMTGALSTNYCPVAFFTWQ